MERGLWAGQPKGPSKMGAYTSSGHAAGGQHAPRAGDHVGGQQVLCAAAAAAAAAAATTATTMNGVLGRKYARRHALSRSNARSRRLMPWGRAGSHALTRAHAPTHGRARVHMGARQGYDNDGSHALVHIVVAYVDVAYIVMAYVVMA